MRSNAGQIQNWEGSIVSHPKVVVTPKGFKDLIKIVTDTTKYPSPVRPLGANCSTTRCAVADQGTLVDMTNMKKILEITADTVRVQAGARCVDVARVLKNHGLELCVNLEMGSLTVGSAACGGTKAASMQGEFGQLSSYVISMKLVTPSGKLLTVTEGHQDLLRVMRSSYGLMGIIYEVTLKVRPVNNLAIEQETYSLSGFLSHWPGILRRRASMTLHLYPFLDKITVGYKRYSDTVTRSGGLRWRFRSWAFRRLLPATGYLATRWIPVPRVRYFIIDQIARGLDALTGKVVSGSAVEAVTQVDRLPERTRLCRYTYSTWAFAEDGFPEVVKAFFKFSKDYYRNQGYRCNLFNVGHRIHQDTNSLLSYSFNGPVITLDPVSTGDAGWDDFLVDYNEFCSRHGGVPLFNQTKAVTHEQAEKAFGQRLKSFEGLRRKIDPQNRLINQYFMELLH